MAALKIQTAPLHEAVTLDEVKEHLRMAKSATEDDMLLQGLSTAVRESVEARTYRALVTQVWDYYLDRFPSENRILIPFGRLQSVDVFEYTDDANATTAVASTVYGTDTAGDPGAIYLKPSQSWPTATLWPSNPVHIRFTCGYGRADSVPQGIKQAILLTIEHYYINTREVVVEPGLTPIQIPLGAGYLLMPYRLYSF